MPSRANEERTSRAKLPQRRHPAHHLPIERHNAPIILFVTLCIRPRVNGLAHDGFHRVFPLAAADADAWSVGYYMVMPDHVHLFCRSAKLPAVSVKRWSRYLKERLTKRGGPFSWSWQSDCWDTQIRDARHYHERWEYVRANPVRAGLVDDSDDWPYQGELHTLQW